MAFSALFTSGQLNSENIWTAFLQDFLNGRGITSIPLSMVKVVKVSLAQDRDTTLLASYFATEIFEFRRFYKEVRDEPIFKKIVDAPWMALTSDLIPKILLTTASVDGVFKKMFDWVLKNWYLYFSMMATLKIDQLTEQEVNYYHYDRRENPITCYEEFIIRHFRHKGNSNWFYSRENRNNCQQLLGEIHRKDSSVFIRILAEEFQLFWTKCIVLFREINYTTMIAGHLKDWKNKDSPAFIENYLNESDFFQSIFAKLLPKTRSAKGGFAPLAIARSSPHQQYSFAVRRVHLPSNPTIMEHF